MLEHQRARSSLWITLLMITSTSSAFHSKPATTLLHRRRSTNAAMVMEYSKSQNDQPRRITNKLKNKLSSFMSDAKKQNPNLSKKSEDEKRIEEYLQYIHNRENRLKSSRTLHKNKKSKKPKDFFVTKPRDYISAAFKNKSSSSKNQKEEPDDGNQYLEYIGHRYDRLRTDDYSYIQSQWYNNKDPTKRLQLSPDGQNIQKLPASTSSGEKRDSSQAINGLFGKSSSMRSFFSQLKQKNDIDNERKTSQFLLLKKSSKIIAGTLLAVLFLRTTLIATVAIGLRTGVILA
eukprot:CAMPEP_0178917454 /NCGR_PEP_ID=MMETSP0786-20121207/13257_1 /TAXON_ID=186022 /ORGANISM="Thalassionema frauenfeldii, Strain CCMP 1798" /LENGTH=288 /DNA_ID=CAMNT_0020591009 /DNA_START=22 /DNA_END=888 /DNA_ORIENTATION=-